MATSGLIVTGLLLLLVSSCSVRGSACPSCPVFSQDSYSSSVPEDAAIGSSVVQLSATDPDGDTLSFSIASGGGATSFSIDNSTGLISVQNSLDYETTSSYTLYIVVTDGWSEVVAMVSITVLDVVYHVQCVPMVLRVEVAENVAATTNTSQRLVCQDPDHTDASFTFSLSSSSGAGEPVISLDDLGFVLLAHELDYELQTWHTVAVSFIDQHGNPAAGNATVVVSVLPVNEFSPQFSETLVSISVAETARPATSVGQVIASDGDSGLDGQLTYGVAGGNGSLHFTVHPSTGDVISISPLDYELSSHYLLVVTATDNPSNTSTALSANVTLSILVTDDNDNSPLFSKYVYRASVSEDAGSVAVLQVHCTDEDSGTNQAVTYSITDISVTQFSIVGSSGEIEVETALDYETSQQYLFTVQCTDNGSPSLSDTAMVIIVLMGANEFTPTFATSTVVYNVPEDTIAGAQLGQLVATDGDTGLAGAVSFAVLHSASYCPDNLIQIDAQTGKMHLIGTLDYESPLIPSHQLLCQVQAEDSQQVVRTGTIDVLVAISNTNDNQPLCDPSVIVTTVPEDTASSSLLESFSCSDADSSPLGYTLVPTSSMFSLDTSGPSVQLLLTQSLDYENETSHHVTVLVADGTFTTAINIFIVITEVNEHSPIFTQVEYHCSVSEMVAPGTSLLCSVRATDADHGNDGELHYAITTSSNYFTVNSTAGIIIVTNSLDYETDPIEFSLVVSAIDHSLTAVRSGSASVVITLLDENDHAPVMELSSIFTVSEAAGIGGVVGIALCSDADSGSNGAVTYSILSTSEVFENGTMHPSSSLPFSIDNSTGVIKTTAMLDYETVIAYQLQLKCADLGTPQHATESVAVISVEPANEFSPLFVFPPPPGLSLVINPQMDTIGSTLITISATDQDKGKDGSVTYSIKLINPISESHVQVVAVDSHSGALGLVSQPSCALGDQLTYQLTAIDGGTPPRNASTTVTALVMQNCNLLPPSSSASLYAANVLETAQENTSVVQITCIDPNPLSSLVIKYMITSDSSVFAIDEDTGKVRVAASLDYEQAHQVMINVRCYYSDEATPLNADMSVYINILAANEYSPVFNMSAAAVIHVSEDTPPGAVVVTAQATDGDQGEDGRVTYTLVTDGPFDLDMFTGNVYLIGMLDREKRDEYLLEMVAHDNAPNEADRRASTATVSVLVQDSNDNYPQCPQQLYRVIIVHQDNVPGTALVQLNCTDLDEGNNGKLAYAIIGPEQTILATMNETTGVLSLTSPITGNTPRQHTLEVAVTDSGTLSLSITVHVFITLDLQTGYVTDQREDAQVEAQQNTVSVTVDRVNSNSWSSAAEEALKVTLAQAATAWCALDPNSCSILSGCVNFISAGKTKRQVPSHYISFSTSDVAVLIDMASANSLTLTMYIRIPVGTAKALLPATHHVIPRVTLEQIVTNNEATIGAVVRDNLPQQPVSSSSWMHIAIAGLTVFAVLVLTAFVVVIATKVHKSFSKRKNVVVPMTASCSSQLIPSRQASSSDGCSLIDVSPPSSAAAAGEWRRKDTLKKLRSHPPHPFAVNDDDDDIQLIRT